MGDYTPEDWALMNRQRAVYQAEERAKQALELLLASRDAPTFGYLIKHKNNTGTLRHHVLLRASINFWCT